MPTAFATCHTMRTATGRTAGPESPPVMVERAAQGVDYFVEHIYPQTSSFGTQVIVNVSGASVDGGRGNRLPDLPQPSATLRGR